MKTEEIRKTFRQPSAEAYPELAAYTREQIHSGKMGPGGLYLAVQMVRRLNLRGGERILDLGCGKGTTAVFLAKECGASVIALDLWISSSELHRRFEQEAVADQIVPLNLDISGKLPFAHDYFDARSWRMVSSSGRTMCFTTWSMEEKQRRRQRMLINTHSGKKACPI